MNVLGRRSAALALAGCMLVPVAVAPAAAADPVTLNLWIFEGEDGILPKFKEGFEASHPGITLEITLIPEDLYVTKLDTAFAAGSTPDIAYVYEPRWLKTGAFLPLDERLAANGIDLSRYAQGPLGACQLDGKLYCIGSYLGLSVVLYDKQLFDAAGVAYPSPSVPMSVDEYAALAATFAKPDADLSKRVWGGEVAATYWWMDTANLFSPDGRTAVGYVDDDATIHAWDTLARMANEGSAMTASEQEAAGIESSDMFATHQIAMSLDDNTYLGELQAQGVDVGVAPLPVEQSGDPVWASTWTDSWGIPSASAHPEEALALLTWIATEGNRIRAEDGSLPLDVQLAQETDWAAGSPERQVIVDLAAQSRPRVFVPGLFSVLGATFEDAFNRAVDSGDAATALHDAAPIMQDDLDREWESWEKLE